MRFVLHECMMTPRLSVGYHASGSVAATTFLSAVSRRQHYREVQGVADAVYDRATIANEAAAQAIRKQAKAFIPKTGPQPWPDGTVFVFIIIRYRSGVRRVQRTPLTHAKNRFRNQGSGNGWFSTRELAEAGAVAEAERERSASRAVYVAARGALERADNAWVWTRDAIRNRTSRSTLRSTP